MRVLFFNKALRILLFTNGFILIAGAMLGPIYALFVDKIGGNLLDASITGGVFSFAAGCTVLVSGKYSDKLRSHVRTVITGYWLIGIGFLCYLFVESIWSLLLVQVVIGIGEAIYSPAFDALYSKHLTPHKAGLQWGAWEAMNYFSICIGAILGGFIVTYLSFETLFVFMAILAFASSLYIYFLPRKVL